MNYFNLLKPLFTAVLLLAVFTRCASEPDKSEINTEKIRGTWVLQSVSGGTTNEEEDEMLASSQKNEIVKEGVSLSLFEDHTFTDIRGKGGFTYGHWKFNESDKTLELKGASQTEKFSIASAFLNERLSMELTNLKTKEKMVYVQTGLPLVKYKEDQFYIENNLWRMKPERPETAKQLQERMANYIKHVAYILKSSTERKQEIVSFTYSMGPIKIYSGGIGIHYLEDVSPEFKNVFYNEEDAVRAYVMYESYLEESVYRGAGTGDWVKDDYVILESIYSDFKTKKLYEEE